jgi:hypothetical protein
MNKNPDIGVAVRRGIITSFVAWLFLAVVVGFLFPHSPPDSPPDEIDETAKLFFILIIPMSMLLGALEGVRYWIDDRKKEKCNRMSDLCK